MRVRLGPSQPDALAAAWTVLAGLLAAAPDAASVARVRDESMLADWPLLEEGAEPGLALLRESRDAYETASIIADDHLRLFRGAGQVLAPPWASVYFGEDRLLFGEETLRVRAAYAEHELQVPNLNREPDDHIAAELMFCAELLLRSLDAADAGDEARAGELATAHDRFVREHLAPYAYAFFALVTQHAATWFYAGVAALGVHAVEVATRTLR